MKSCRLVFGVALLELLDKLVDFLQFLGYVDFLRAVTHALAAADAVVGLTQAWHAVVIAHEERLASASMFAVFLFTNKVALC